MHKHLQVCKYPATGNMGDCVCEAVIYTRCSYITSGVLLMQITVWLVSLSLALGADTLHVGSDLFVILGLLFVSKRTALLSKQKKKKWRNGFAYMAIAVLVIGASIVFMEAHERFLSPRDILDWQILLPVFLGGVGNWFVHQELHRIPSEHKDHAHNVVHWHVRFDIAASCAVFISVVIRMLADHHSWLVGVAPYADSGTGAGIGVYMLILAPILAWKIHTDQPLH